MTAPPLYSLKNLRRNFCGREILSIDELTIEPGLIYSLVGPNGSGKSTLMKLLAFLEQADGGEIYFLGQKVKFQNLAEVRSQVVWSPQFPVMFSGSLIYNVEYPLKLRGFKGGALGEKAWELLNQVGLSHLAKSPAQRLSGGEAQRASLARSLATGAKIMLLDEPTANVDAQARQELLRLIEKIWSNQKLSIIITTHDKDLEASLCQRRLSLHNGRLESVQDMNIHLGYLREIKGVVTLFFQPENHEFRAGLGFSESPEPPKSLSIIALAAEEVCITMTVKAPLGDLKQVNIKDEVSLKIANKLTLGPVAFAGLRVASEVRPPA
ncbi:MAG: ABC transporter ATP-binding protein [Candidatus Adiutrix sp.]